MTGNHRTRWRFGAEFQYHCDVITMKLDYMSRLETAEGGVTYHFSLHIKGLDQARATELQQEALRLVAMASMEEQHTPEVRPTVAACSAARCPDLIGSREGKNLSRTCRAAGGKRPGNLPACPTGHLTRRSLTTSKQGSAP